MPRTNDPSLHATVDLESADATVLVVDDDADLAETYALWLREHVAVHTAFDGADALDALAAFDVDVVLLDRRMPSMSGDALLAAMRDRGHDQRVAMVTAVEPALSVVEMPFDDYLVKPVGRDALLSTVEALLALDEHADAFREYFALESKLAVLEAGPAYRDEDEADDLAALRERVAESRERALAALEGVPKADPEGRDAVTDT
ncbi:response regulator [Halorubellus sp. JP-L1]|uniref:response regulator n=1 Tax=Halorubellus sp. JP-L1 TaxID=2715753 RepID=UPI00140E5F81|nr:response regulator [Halorubellus sp. JP-L1]NHN41313.1 response regulator [Halorubellus sp. JP-L1]